MVPENFDIPANEWQNDKDDEEIRDDLKAWADRCLNDEINVLLKTQLTLLIKRTPDCMSAGQVQQYALGDQEIIKQFKGHVDGCPDYCTKMLSAYHRYLAWKEMTGRD